MGMTNNTDEAQRGHGFRPAGSKLSRKASRNALDNKRVGVVSKAYEQMSKDRRRA